MNQPNTDWKEIIQEGETELYESFVKKFETLQLKMSSIYGKGRALHRKQLLAANAELEIFDNLAEPARHGLFSKPAKYSCLIRLSNGGMRVQNDAIPDIRGFAIKVLGVKGKGALGEMTNSQDFLLINHEVSGTRNSKDFVDLVMAAFEGNLNVLWYMLTTYGIFGMIDKIKRLMGNSFSGFATENFYSALPMCCGPYAMRVRIVPEQKDVNPEAPNDWGKDIKDRLQKSSLNYLFQIQFFINEELTPIENPSKNWDQSDSPYHTVGRLVLPVQSFSGTYETFAEEVEYSIFDPWNALVEHRPLGDLMRARKYVYYGSQKNRK